jgi:hypothetical protein
MVAATKAKPEKPFKPRRQMPKRGSKTEAILTLTTTTPATPSQVARAVDTSPALVYRVMERYGIEPNHAQSYKEHRADILAGMQAKILAHVDDERLKKAPAGSLILAACQLYDKERLERDMSTANIASVHADIAALRQGKSVDK